MAGLKKKYGVGPIGSVLEMGGNNNDGEVNTPDVSSDTGDMQKRRRMGGSRLRKRQASTTLNQGMG